jgi:hypothetical protein
VTQKSGGNPTYDIAKIRDSINSLPACFSAVSDTDNDGIFTDCTASAQVKDTVKGSIHSKTSTVEIWQWLPAQITLPVGQPYAGQVCACFGTIDSSFADNGKACSDLFSFNINICDYQSLAQVDLTLDSTLSKDFGNARLQISEAGCFSGTGDG